MIVEQFFQWVTTAPADKRAKATRALAEAFFVSDMSEDDRSAAEAAMTFLLDDPDREVRKALASVVVHRQEAPRHIILGLMDDEDEVSLMAVAHSPVLIDSELVDLVAMRELPFQLAIARRRNLSAGVAAAISEVASLQVCIVLLQNEDAVVLSRTLYRLSERFGENDTLRALLLKRPNLPIAARQMMIAKMSEALGNRAVQSAQMQYDQAVDATREARDRATLTLLRTISTDELPELIEHLRQTEQLTTVLLLRAICAGKIDFFIEALTVLSGVNHKRIAALLTDSSSRALKTVYHRAGLPEEAYPAFSIAFDVYVEEGVVLDVSDQYRFTRIMIERILERYKLAGSSEIDEILSMLRRFASETARDAARDYVNNQIDHLQISAA